MAITLENTPSPVMAAFNSCYYKILSTNSGQPNFKYLIRATVSGAVSFVQNYEVVPLVGQPAFWDAQPMAGLIPLKPLMFTRYGVSKWNNDPICKVTIFIQESYTGVASPPPSITHEFQVWGASKNTFDLYKAAPNYAYVWPGVGTPAQGVNNSQMQNLLPEKVYENTDTYFGVWNYNAGNFRGIFVFVYNLNGVLISNSIVDSNNFNLGAAQFANGLIYINVGMRSLRAMVPSLGNNPILPAGTNFTYNLHFIWNNGGPDINQLVKKYIPTCAPVFPIMPIHWKSRLGAWETQIFAGNSIQSLNKVSENFESFERVVANALMDDGSFFNPIYSRSVAKERNIETTRTIELNTLWLTEAEVEKCADLFDSPQVYTVVSVPAGANYLVELRPVPNSYVINKRYNKKKFQINMAFKYAFSENRQM
jgi:hypothetical protein